MSVKNTRYSPRTLALLGGPDKHGISDNVLGQANPLSLSHTTTPIGVCDKANALEQPDVDTLLCHRVNDFPKATWATRGTTLNPTPERLRANFGHRGDCLLLETFGQD